MKSTTLVVLAVAASVLLLIPQTMAAGGIAEMKALTGDAPYLGVGNQEQAPEYFGDALARQYYQNPAYGYAPASPWSNYNLRNAYYGGGGYRPNYYGYGMANGGYNGGYNAGYNAPAAAPVAPAVSSVPSVGSSSGFYSGSGNEWVKQ